mmetsp:Transcript_18780/g.59927  ORF Transcript_18780/g.59927 Transcript_18780/m.59927 type:complete len:201 (+) Transcript_18780:226-828(+)
MIPRSAEPVIVHRTGAAPGLWVPSNASALVQPERPGIVNPIVPHQTSSFLSEQTGAQEESFRLFLINCAFEVFPGDRAKVGVVLARLDQKFRRVNLSGCQPVVGGRLDEVPSFHGCLFITVFHQVHTDPELGFGIAGVGGFAHEHESHSRVAREVCALLILDPFHVQNREIVARVHEFCLAPESRSQVRQCVPSSPTEGL